MIDKVQLILPEIALFVTTCVVMVVGLLPSLHVRRCVPWLAGIGLLIAGGLAIPAGPAESAASAVLFPELMPYFKTLVSIVGIMLLLVLAGTVDRDMDEAIERGRGAFDALRANRAEFYAFFLFSLTGLMLCASADGLIWLFLALELTSLPTYIMVSISMRGRAEERSQEAGVKYFFLGALGAAVFLYGFALIYGATGAVHFPEIRAQFAAQAAAGGLNPIGLAGLVIALLGLGFKIAAVPMHFYAADVYQGAASGVAAMLAFVPKAAGFVAVMLLCGTTGWALGPAGEGLPQPVYILLWVMAAATMFAGNTLALLQTSVKRMLAYSSVAHTGYMLVGVIAGPGRGGGFWDNGLAAMLFYLLCYGVMNVGAFAVLSSLERRGGEEIDDIEDIRGLHKDRPHLAAAMLLCVLSLIGFPPLLGFFGKLGLFTAGVAAGEITLVVILGVNSAIAALYYLRLVSAAYLDPRDEERAATTRLSPFPTRIAGALVSAGGVVVLAVLAQPLITESLAAAELSRDPEVSTPLRLDGHRGAHGGEAGAADAEETSPARPAVSRR